jgi:PilZ domain
MEDPHGTEPLTEPPERRSETRDPAKEDYNAEIKMLGYPVYQVKIADISPTGAGIVVKEDSSLLGLLTVGRVLDVRFHAGESENQPDAVKEFKAEVKHISEVRAGRYKGHRLVGIQVLGNE